MRRTSRRAAVVGAAVVAVLGLGAGPAGAVTVTLPCGCTPVDHAHGSAASTPAADNPTGTVGGSVHTNSSAIVRFTG